MSLLHPETFNKRMDDLPHEGHGEPRHHLQFTFSYRRRYCPNDALCYYIFSYKIIIKCIIIVQKILVLL